MKPDARGEFPKIIWMLWLQGWDVAPELVNKCALSWRRHHPDWQIVFLNEENLKAHIDVDAVISRNRSTISAQARSNIIRINLLAKFGGVWVDATCFCCRPLDEWIEPHLAAGFFAFEKPGQDRLIASWFLAARKNSHLANAYCAATNDYWMQNYFPFQKSRWARPVIKLLGKILNRNAHLAGLWTHPVTTKIFRVHPYHWFHYTFSRVLATDPRSAELWRQSLKFPADIPHRLMIADLFKPATPAVKAAIDARQDPLYKLNWRCAGDLPSDSTLDYLWRSI